MMMMMMMMMSILTSAFLRFLLFLFIYSSSSISFISSLYPYSQQTHSDDMELEDAIHTALLTLKESYDGEMDEHNIEVAVVSDEDKLFKLLTPQEVKDFLDEAT